MYIANLCVHIKFFLIGWAWLLNFVHTEVPVWIWWIGQMCYSRHVRLHVPVYVYIRTTTTPPSHPHNRARRCIVWILLTLTKPLPRQLQWWRQPMTSTKTSSSQCSSSRQVTHIHTYMQGPDVLKSISCVLIAWWCYNTAHVNACTYGVVFLIEWRYVDRGALIMIHT